MSSHEEFAAKAPSGRVVISGATTGLEVLERALAGWPVPESTTRGRTPPRMHREISGTDDLMHIADGIDLIFRYQRLWTEDKMKRVARIAVSIFAVIRDL